MGTSEGNGLGGCPRPSCAVPDPPRSLSPNTLAEHRALLPGCAPPCPEDRPPRPASSRAGSVGRDGAGLAGSHLPRRKRKRERRGAVAVETRGGAGGGATFNPKRRSVGVCWVEVQCCRRAMERAMRGAGDRGTTSPFRMAARDRPAFVVFCRSLFTTGWPAGRSRPGSPR